MPWRGRRPFRHTHGQSFNRPQYELVLCLHRLTVVMQLLNQMWRSQPRAENSALSLSGRDYLTATLYV